ncbi:MAG TPA: 1,4-dihydroxy-2-naphthoate polyprenyltransferase, partial [Ilumatobacteraceae bacterium]|nr:1,4-dihydroxy-2-naphthoate polyprenyltransferase [Ilumatobacteraceae bacterium]
IIVIAAVWRAWAVIALGGLVVAVPPIRSVLGGASGRELVSVLGATGRTQLAMGLLLAIGLALGPITT